MDYTTRMQEFNCCQKCGVS